MFEKYVTTVDLDGKQIELTLNDTAGKRKFSLFETFFFFFLV